MLNRKQVLETIKKMPESFLADDLIERIVLLQKIEIGLEQVKLGKTYSLKKAEGKLKKWLK